MFDRKKFGKASSMIKSHHLASYANRSDDAFDDYTDPLYESLRRMSKSLTSVKIEIKQTNKFSLHHCKTKELTSVVNEVYCTDGYGQMIGDYQFLQKTTSKQFVPCLENSVHDFQLSDTVSIDIDENSTYLPLMCKLMIILQGAAVERGKPILVRDIGMQVLDVNVDRHLFSVHNKFKSIDEECEDLKEIETIESTKLPYNVSKNKIVCTEQTDNISGRRDSYYRRQSYFTTNEYYSVPYFQYQNKRAVKKDSSSNTDFWNEDNKGQKPVALTDMVSVQFKNEEPIKGKSIDVGNCSFSVKSKSICRKSIFEQVYDVLKKNDVIGQEIAGNNPDEKYENKHIILKNRNQILTNDKTTAIKLYNSRCVTRFYFVSVEKL